MVRTLGVRGGPKVCIMCKMHPDSQHMVFVCPEIVPHLKSEGKYENMFGSTISKDTIMNIIQIKILREEKLKD